jgi:hypothetical protein
MKIVALTALYGFALASLDRVEQAVRIAALLVPIVVGIVQLLRRPPRRKSRSRRNIVVLSEKPPCDAA